MYTHTIRKCFAILQLIVSSQLKFLNHDKQCVEEICCVYSHLDLRLSKKLSGFKLRVIYLKIKKIYISVNRYNISIIFFVLIYGSKKNRPVGFLPAHVVTKWRLSDEGS